MTYSIFDLEANGLLENVTKIHCVCVNKTIKDDKTGVCRYESYSLTNYDEMRNFFLNEEIIIGHNIVRYDIPVLEKILGIKIKARALDTLAFSWYLFPKRVIHGLEEWGADFGIEKPPIVDWQGLPVEQYIYRCSEDVRINTCLFELQKGYFMSLYKEAGIDSIMNYLTYKMQCAAEAEEMKWRLDVPICSKNLAKLSEIRNAKLIELVAAMPKVTTYIIKSKPKVTHKKDGTLGVHGQNWYNLLASMNLPEYHNGAVKVVHEIKDGNPNSPQQIKDWLFSYGWQPATFKYVKEKNEEGQWVQRSIPQISADDGSGICSSIKLLFPEHPELKVLDDYSVLKHRVGLLEGFLRDVDDEGFLKAEVSGFTNTLRFKHKTIVNLPQTPKKYWREIRECLIAPSDEYELCGSDMSGLEDCTKQHYMYYFDPEYVKEMRTYGFDPHCDIAVLGKAMSREEECFYKWYVAKKEDRDYERIVKEYKERNLSNEVRFANTAIQPALDIDKMINLSKEVQEKIISVLKLIRLKSKKGNFAAVYGAGAPKLAVTLNIPIAESTEFHKTYWIRNAAVKKVANSCIVRDVNGQLWVYNPVSRFWLSLREEKDKFSTLNQSTGVYCFDTWNRNVRKRGIALCGQFHDEIIFPVIKGGNNRTHVTNLLQEAITETNEQLKLNVPLAISVDFGNSYMVIH